jgi:ABC-type microcin C transport system permease subunit YejB
MAQSFGGQERSDPGNGFGAQERSGFDRHVFRILLVIVIVTLAIGTTVYHYVEHLAWIDAYYFSVVTLATVGYGDFAPHTAFGKLFTTFYIFVGVGILATFISYNMRRYAGRIVPHRHDDQSGTSS